MKPKLQLFFPFCRFVPFFNYIQWAYVVLMDNEPVLHPLIPLTDFKAILGLDDRDDTLSRYCLIMATYTIEQYCKRRILSKKRFEFLPFYGDYTFPLQDYPVREVLAVYQTHALKESIIVESDFYHTIPECGELEDIPFSLSVSPALRLVRDLSGLKVHYRAGMCRGRFRLTWPRRVWNWRPGIWPVTGGGVSG